MSLGGSEIVVIIIVALVIFGPDKLPMALKNFGRIMGEIRKYQDMAKKEIDKAVSSVSDMPNSKNKSGADQDKETKPQNNARPIDEIQAKKRKSNSQKAPKQESVAPILDEDD